jgi:hypothetical protein
MGLQAFLQKFRAMNIMGLLWLKRIITDVHPLLGTWMQQGYRQQNIQRKSAGIHCSKGPHDKTLGVFNLWVIDDF